MRVRFLFALLAAVVASASLDRNTLVVHEKRDKFIHDARPMDPNEVLEMRIGLSHNPVAQAKAHDWLMEVSDPDSAMYGQHWTSEDVVSKFQPTDESLHAITAWLAHSGNITKDRLAVSANKAWLRFHAPAVEIERLLHTKYYHHGPNGEQIGCDQYHIPSHLTGHIELIAPGVISGQAKSISSRSNQARSERRMKQPRKTNSPPTWGSASVITAPKDLSNCTNQVTPACIQALYRFSRPDAMKPVSKNNTLGILEFDYYAQSDMNDFFSTFAPWVPAGTKPKSISIDGGLAAVSPARTGGEANLDFQMAIPIIHPQTTSDYAMINYHFADGGNSSFNTWLDALDGSYCNYSAYGETGDDPKFDPKYPDPKGYKGQRQCGTYKPANVISISFGGQESQFPAAYQKRMCNEFLKLGLQGVSILFATGDYGVAGFPNSTVGTTNGCLRRGRVFNPSSIATCPYITSVGGTQIQPGKGVTAPEGTYNIPSVKYPAIRYASSGGFSNIFPVASYQKTAVAAYFASYAPSYPYYTGGNYHASQHGLYNRNGRAYPDVAANAVNISMVTGGKTELSGGTSAATPIFAGLINRIVEERLRVGKGPVGFLNPTLYKHPEVLNDITIGSNPGCGTQGFQASKGWDPATGLGTPNYPRMLQLFMSLK